jgi:hypothetical protein
VKTNLLKESESEISVIKLKIPAKLFSFSFSYGSASWNPCLNKLQASSHLRHSATSLFDFLLWLFWYPTGLIHDAPSCTTLQSREDRHTPCIHSLVKMEACKLFCLGWPGNMILLMVTFYSQDYRLKPPCCLSTKSQCKRYYCSILTRILAITMKQCREI